MYGKGLGVANSALGVSLLTPDQNRVLFVIGAALLVSGIVILVASSILGRERAANSDR